MKLKEYLDEEGYIYRKFADKLGISYPTMLNLFKGKDITHSLALLIVYHTKGQVTHEDLAPKGFCYSKNYQEIKSMKQKLKKEKGK